ncbi:Bug family tripartite tricarboxylate transporter substrate binding protein [Advenella kashmirensis]
MYFCNTRKSAAVLLAGCALVNVCSTAAAVDVTWPQQPVTMVVPFPPGGPTDIVARQLAKQLAQRLGQPFVVENRGGANATIGMQHVATAKPDGYTILYNTSSIALSPALYPDLSYDPTTAFDPVSTTANVPMVVLVNPKMPVDNLEQLKAHVTAHKTSYASSGVGNITHLGGFLLNKGLDIKALHVPYKGSAPAMVDLMGGQVDYMVNTLNDSLSAIRGKKVKILALASLQRNEQVLPGVPTVDEAGVKDFEIGAWQGVVVPRGTPQPIIDKLNKTIRDTLDSPDFKATLQKQGTDTLGSTPQAYRQFILQETKRWKQVVRQAGVKSN